MAYELQIISRVLTDILHDVAGGHPFGDQSEPPVLEGIRNTDKAEDIWVGKVLPPDNFFTEMLYGVNEPRWRTWLSV